VECNKKTILQDWLSVKLYYMSTFHERNFDILTLASHKQSEVKIFAFPNSVYRELQVFRTNVLLYTKLDGIF